MHSASLASGTKLGKYLIVRLIGSGGMGDVYEATHIELRKRVALKTLLPALASNPEARARFLREGEAASRIEHPNVVNVTDVGSEGDTPFLVMEFLEGENLAQQLRREGGMALPVLLDLLFPIMDALASGHDEGVVHRDLKPQNIFLSRGRDGRLIPKLLDFGVSKIVDDDRAAALTGSLAVLGTAQYMAPEQIDGPKNVDARTDQYAMGLVLFECFTGSPAREGTSPLAMLRAIAADASPSLLRVRPDADPGFAAVVSRALSFAFSERFASMRDLMRALLPFARPQTRAQWGEALTGRVDVVATPPMAHTVLLADSSPGSPSASTFRSASGEHAAPTYRTRSPGRTGALVAVGIAIVGAGGFFAVRGLPSRSDPRPSAPTVRDEAPPASAAASDPPRALPPVAKPRFQVRATPPDATIAVDGENLGRSPVTVEARPGAHQLIVSARGFRAVTVEFADDRPPPALIELVPEAAPPPEHHRRGGSATPAHRPHHPSPAPAEPTEPEPEPARRGVNDSLILQ